MTRKKEQEQFISYITERQTHEGQMAVADFLRKYAVRYHNSDFISSDPVQFPHRYHSKADIEISAFLTAFLSFSNFLAYERYNGTIPVLALTKSL